MSDQTQNEWTIAGNYSTKDVDIIDGDASTVEPLNFGDSSVSGTVSTDFSDYSDPVISVSLPQPKSEISDEFEERGLYPFTVEEFIEDVEGMNTKRWKRVKNIVVRCAGCMEKYFLKTLLRDDHLCPNCSNKIFGAQKEDEHKMIKEILIGKEEEADDEVERKS